MATNEQKQDQDVHSKRVKNKSNLQSIHKEMKQIRIDMQEVEERLQSWGLTTMETIGLAVDDVTEDSHLYILPNEKLSRNDLSRKHGLLQDKLAELDSELRGQHAVIRQLKFDAKVEKAKRHGDFVKQQREEIVSEYYREPEAFFAEYAIDMGPEWAWTDEEIFAAADKLLAISNDLDINSKLENIWYGWKVVAKARNIAADQYNNYVIENKHDEAVRHTLFSRNEHYAIGAKKYFSAFVQLLPLGMQGLKLLYDARDFDRVDYYLSEIFSENIVDNHDEYIRLLIDLSIEISDACMKNSKKILSRLSGFNQLDRYAKKVLIEEHTFASKYRFDISMLEGVMSPVEIEPFNVYAKNLDDHITDILNIDMNAEAAEIEFSRIKLQIYTHAKEIRKSLFSPSYDVLSEALNIGSGLGLGWLYGADELTPSRKVVGVQELEDDLNLSSALEAEDVDFIKKEDRFWENNISASATPRDSVSIISRIFKRVYKSIKSVFTKRREDNIKKTSQDYVLTFSGKTIGAIDQIAPGFGHKLLSHFQRRANDIRMAMEQAENVNSEGGIEVMTNDLEELEMQLTQILDHVHDKEEFCAAVDLYLTTRYMAERTQYIEISKDLHQEPYIDQERRIMLCEYQHEREEIKELHELKEILQQIVSPNANISQ